MEVKIVDTDTVQAYICSVFSKNDVKKIFEIKKRDYSKNLPVFVSSLEMLWDLTPYNELLEQILKEKWPGAYTVIVPLLSKYINNEDFYLGDGPKDTIAVRIPNSEKLIELIEQVGPLAQTSANISGMEPSKGNGTGISSEIWDWTQKPIKRIR